MSNFLYNVKPGDLVLTKAFGGVTVLGLITEYNAAAFRFKILIAGYGPPFFVTRLSGTNHKGDMPRFLGLPSQIEELKAGRIELKRFL